MAAMASLVSRGMVYISADILEPHLQQSDLMERLYRHITRTYVLVCGPLRQIPRTSKFDLIMKSHKT